MRRVPIFCLIGFIVFPLLEKPLKAKQSTIHGKELWQTSTVSFVSEPVWMAHCPAVETWFQGSESLLRISFSSGTQARRGQQRDGMKRRLQRRTMKPRAFSTISPCIYLRLSKCLPVHLSYFPLYFLIVLISRKTHEYQQPLRNLMDLEWTWELKKHCNSSNISLSRGFIWMKLSWLQYFCSYTLVWMWRSSSFCAETMTSLNKRVVGCRKYQSTS